MAAVGRGLAVVSAAGALLTVQVLLSLASIRWGGVLVVPWVLLIAMVAVAVIVLHGDPRLERLWQRLAVVGLWMGPSVVLAVAALRMFNGHLPDIDPLVVALQGVTAVFTPWLHWLPTDAVQDRGRYLWVTAWLPIALSGFFALVALWRPFAPTVVEPGPAAC